PPSTVASSAPAQRVTPGSSVTWTSTNARRVFRASTTGPASTSRALSGVIAPRASAGRGAKSTSTSANRTRARTRALVSTKPEPSAASACQGGLEVSANWTSTSVLRARARTKASAWTPSTSTDARVGPASP
ncbi:UNVERIFIED_CONTAM: hypothetical protein GTU68_019851, partial [Idotea baltica]|nr:hypothetical protein [Idotea baltica]